MENGIIADRPDLPDIEAVAAAGRRRAGGTILADPRIPATGAPAG